MYIYWVLPIALVILILLAWAGLRMLAKLMRDRKVNKRWIVLLWILGPVLLVFGPTVLNILFNIEVYTAKEGRVVDVNTGKGIPHAAVIAAATMSGSNFIHGSAYGTLYRVTTYTDELGDYRIPSYWSNVVLWFPPLPGTAPTITWVIAVLQPGYGVVGDELAWQFDGAIFPSASGPPASWRGTVVKVDPIEMKRVAFTLKEAAVYYSRILSVAPTYRGHDPEQAKLLKMVSDILLPQVCGMDPNSTVDGTAGRSLSGLVEDPYVSSGRLLQLEPSGYGDAYQHTVFHAGNVCEAMKAGAKHP